MNVVDLVLGAFLAFALFKGLRNGLFIELASLAAFLVGIYCAIKFSYLMISFFPISYSPKTIKIVAFIATLLIVIIGVHLLAKLLSKLASFAFVGWLNKLGGAVFAALKTAILLGIMLNFVEKLNYNDLLISSKNRHKSALYYPILNTSNAVLPILKNWFVDLKNKTGADS